MQASETTNIVAKLTKIAINPNAVFLVRQNAIFELKRLHATEALLEVADNGITDCERMIAMDYYRAIMDSKTSRYATP